MKNYNSNMTSSNSKPTLKYRTFKSEDAMRLHEQGLPVMLARLFAARGVKDVDEVWAGVDKLLPLSSMKNAEEMGRVLADCVDSQQRVLIVSDYDCDGATAGSILHTAFEGAGLNHGLLVPDRLANGYGLTPSIVEQAAALNPKPNIIVTVDNGISSIDGVRRAKELGIDVLVTDHHLCGATLPDARLIVNPNQPGCDFESKHIAGCGVAWYVAGALQKALLEKGKEVGFDHEALLPFVAIGTVADVVRLDKNNRIMVREGLKRIREGQCSAGIKALAIVANRSLEGMTCQDIGFAIGPRINAAGRLSHMGTGIDCLISNDESEARLLATKLDDINTERKNMQKEMIEEAVEQLKDAELELKGQETKASVVVYNSNWHEGVVGILAGRLKDAHHLPTFALCDAQDGNIKGSGRSIEGFHLKHALDEINASHPGLLVRFGGHAMAAGVTVSKDGLKQFVELFDEVCRRHLTLDMIASKIEHDGALPPHAYNEGAVIEMLQEVWGQGFPEPLFVDRFQTVRSRTMGADHSHLKIGVRKGAAVINVVAFQCGDRQSVLPEELVLSFTPTVNVFRGESNVELMAKDLLNVPKPEPTPQASSKISP